MPITCQTFGTFQSIHFGGELGLGKLTRVNPSGQRFQVLVTVVHEEGRHPLYTKRQSAMSKSPRLKLRSDQAHSETDYFNFENSGQGGCRV